MSNIPTSEAYDRMIELTNKIAAEERQRLREWEQQRDGGPGITPGLTASDIEEVCDFVPDESILGQATNPKELAATRDKKAPLHLLEYAADCEIAAALSHGARKYGRKNFQQTPILANVYGGAIRRHVGAWLTGEDIDPESGLSHLAHIGANVHVLLSAMAHRTFVDDRGPEEQSEVQARMSAASNGARP